MSDVFTLESMVEELNNEFAPLTIEARGEKFVLRSLMRVDINERKTVQETLESLDQGQDEEGNDIEPDEELTVDAIHTVIRIVVKENADRLIEAIGRDTMLCARILKRWQEATQPGEAQPSPN